MEGETSPPGGMESNSSNEATANDAKTDIPAEVRPVARQSALSVPERLQCPQTETHRQRTHVHRQRTAANTMEDETAPSGDVEANNAANEAKIQELLKTLHNLQCPPELLTSANQLKTDYKKRPEDLPHLIQHLEALVKFVSKSEEALKEKAESRKHSEEASGSGGFFGSWSYRSVSKLKVFKIVTSETYGADADVLKKLKTHGLEVLEKKTGYDVVLIFCVVISRVGSDVEDAMRRIPEDATEKPVVLVVMHHERKDDLLIDGPQWSSKYKNVKCHVDMVFHQSKSGLLKCDANKRAINKLQENMRNM